MLIKGEYTYRRRDLKLVVREIIGGSRSYKEEDNLGHSKKIWSMNPSSKPHSHKELSLIGILLRNTGVQEWPNLRRINIIWNMIICIVIRVARLISPYEIYFIYYLILKSNLFIRRLRFSFNFLQCTFAIKSTLSFAFQVIQG